jgi:acetate kinase
MQHVQAAADRGNADARLAVAMFARRAAAGIAAAATSLPRLDALVFTGGIGEHAAAVREEIVGRLAGLGFDRSTSLVIEAREDLVIAEETARLLS